MITPSRKSLLPTSHDDEQLSAELLATSSRLEATEPLITAAGTATTSSDAPNAFSPVEDQIDTVRPTTAAQTPAGEGTAAAVDVAIDAVDLAVDQEDSELDAFPPEPTASAPGDILSLRGQRDFDSSGLLQPEESSLPGRSLTRVKSLVNRLVGHEKVAEPNPAPPPDPSAPSVARDRLHRFLEQDAEEFTPSEGTSATKRDESK